MNFAIFKYIALFCCLIFAACGMYDDPHAKGVTNNFYQSNIDPELLKDLHLSYNFSIDNSTSIPKLVIDLEFDIKANKFFLKLPGEFLRKRALYNRIEKIESLEEGQTLIDCSNNKACGNRMRGDYILVDKEASRSLKIRYYLLAFDPGQKQKYQDSFSASVVRKEYVQFISSMALISPELLLAKKSPLFNLKLTFDVSPTMKVFTSFSNESIQNIANASYKHLQDTLVVFGENIRYQKTNIRGNDVYTTLYGSWDHIDDATWTDHLSKLVDAERQFFNDDSSPYYLIHISQLRDSCKPAKYKGTAHINSFRAFVNKECTNTPDLQQLLAHELLHNWIGKKIIFKASDDKHGVETKFLSEGLTDYLSRIIAYEAGVISKEDFFATFNRAVERYYTSAYLKWPMSDIKKVMFEPGLTNSDVEFLPYPQGEMDAMLIDLKIRKTHAKLNISYPIQDMLKEANANGGEKDFSLEQVALVFNKYDGGEFARLHKKIQNGEIIKLKELPNCANVLSTDTVMIKNKLKKFDNFIYSLSPIVGGSCDSWLKFK